MKILDASSGALTNFEVLHLLRSRGAGKDLSRVIASVSPSEYKVFDYLEQTAACNQTIDIINRSYDELRRCELAKAEILNIINMRPASAVEVYPIIEDCESRMEDKIDELVETIMRILPPHPLQKEEPVQESVENNGETEN
ncbi:DNA-directed RNA polymerase III subunit rpc9 [Striga asiatica]|uniref:DNA-directed RNA polymerase III subunit RPC9 n=1 Tax=Striga asiatica TaxID=4170 RepID=A0A5A7QF21_STRAF|nr:DNA-directed RNA polymerase III subunit rpc9 [Striga asiatica]